MKVSARIDEPAIGTREMRLLRKARQHRAGVMQRQEGSASPSQLEALAHEDETRVGRTSADKSEASLWKGVIWCRRADGCSAMGC